jgi:hypothetical protein
MKKIKYLGTALAIQLLPVIALAQTTPPSVDLTTD